MAARYRSKSPRARIAFCEETIHVLLNFDVGSIRRRGIGSGRKTSSSVSRRDEGGGIVERRDEGGGNVERRTMPDDASGRGGFEPARGRTLGGGRVEKPTKSS